MTEELSMRHHIYLHYCDNNSIFHSDDHIIHLLSSLQQSADNSHMTVSRCRMNRSGTTFVWHVQIHALLEEHSGAFRVSVQRCYVHQSGAVFRPLEDACFEFIG